MPNYLCTVFAVFREQRGNPKYNRLQRVSVRPEEGKLVLAILLEEQSLPLPFLTKLLQ